MSGGPETDFLKEAREGVLAYSEQGGLVEQALGRKALMQADLLGHGRPDLQVIEQDDVIVAGRFVAYLTTAQTDWKTPPIKAGETYLDFHMPAKPAKGWTLSDDESYSLLAKRVQDQDFTHLFGITYGTIARAAERRQGFEIARLNLNEPLKRFARASWQNMNPDLKPRHFEEIYAVWLTQKAFLDQFLRN